MSMAIKRASYTGDPGFFDFIKSAASVATSFIPVVGTTISQAIANIGVRGPTVAGPGSVPIAQAFRTSGGCAKGTKYDAMTDRCIPTGFNPLGFGGPGVGAPTPFGRLSIGEVNGLPMPAAVSMNGKSMGGYHPNKSDYFLKSGEFIPAGTRWVKNRKRNPANARATSRAISRISGAKTYAKSLGRISIRKKC